MAIVQTFLGLYALILPRPQVKTVKNLLKKYFGRALLRDEGRLAKLRQKIFNYLSGKKVQFNERLDLREASDFDRGVWQVVSAIPWGEVRSYHWVAKTLGKPRAVQAVGQALACNRLPLIVPCHRVVQKDETLGGFSGGVNMKRTLLRIEGRLW